MSKKSPHELSNKPEMILQNLSKYSGCSNNELMGHHNSSDSRRNSDHYSEKDFWDKRYEADISTYEWYVSFENIKKQLLLDLRKCDSRLAIRNPPLKIMVSGCGNSTLCEDLWREGWINNFT